MPRKWQKNGDVLINLNKTAIAPMAVEVPGLFITPLATANTKNAHAERNTEA